MRSEAVVIQTPMVCNTCRECLLRIMEPDKGADEVLCLSCGGFGETKEIYSGAELKGGFITRTQLDFLHAKIDRAMQDYNLAPPR